MHLRANHRLPFGAALAAIVLVAALFATPAFAAPTTGSSAQIAAKKAEKARVVSRLEGLRADLQLRTDRLTTVGQDLADAQAEVTQVTAQLAEVQTSLEGSKKALSARAAALYRGDRVGMLGLLLGAQSIDDFIVRTRYLILITSRDANMLNDYRLTRSESVWLQDSLARRTERLRTLQAQALAEQTAAQNDIATAEREASAIDYDLAALLRPAPSTDGSGTAQYDPDTLITETKYRSQDMTVTAIQSFLEEQTGSLATYKTRDMSGVTKSAAEIIWDCAQKWNISPRVLLITLQKEQSLLSDATPTSRQLQWAMGAGRPDSGKTNYSMAGFGRQVWYGARALHRNSLPWVAGVSMNIDSSIVYPSNPATYSLYKYTPHLRGTHSFWALWKTYFNENPAQ